MSARRKDRTLHKKTSLLSIRAALDHNLPSSPFNQKISICDRIKFNKEKYNSKLLPKASYQYLQNLWNSSHKSPSTLENTLRVMRKKADVLPYYTNHYLRATTVTVFSSHNVEARPINKYWSQKGPKHLERYCVRPTIDRCLQRFLHSFTSQPCPPNRLIQGQLFQRLNTELNRASQWQQTAFPLAKRKKTSSIPLVLIHKPIECQTISTDVRLLSLQILTSRLACFSLEKSLNWSFSSLILHSL